MKAVILAGGAGSRLSEETAVRPKPMVEIVTEFMEWQDKLGATIRRADGLDLRRARGRSPALPLIKWSLGALFAITLAHERRHLWQARQVRNAL